MTTPRRVLAGFAVLLAAGRAAAGGWRLRVLSLSCLSLLSTCGGRAAAPFSLSRWLRARLAGRYRVLPFKNGSH
jgi:hypothetical protein